MKRTSFDETQLLVTIPKEEDGENNQNQRQQLKKIMRQIICNDLSERQKQICYLYYYKRQTIPQIASLLDVNKSSVSRTLARGLHNVNERIKYYKLR
ncbi:sigma-70 family RNA polymerase sigma factor [Paludicola sp. MB14-C6]|uniref:sigma-70 family RNA polymerase sigma factor n=1 Tax=Paludihabitans sp. MB14-C6 TaxID=3070656 RepID=UPI0035A2C542